MYYDTSLKRKWDNKAVLDYAVDYAVNEALKEERAKAHAEKLKSASKFKKMGIPIADIAKSLNLSIDDVEKL